MSCSSKLYHTNKCFSQYKIKKQTCSMFMKPSRESKCINFILESVTYQGLLVFDFIFWPSAVLG